MTEWFWSYLLVAVGLVGFVLAGQKKWYAWYVNFFCQFLWLAYAVISQQYGFIVGALVYMIVFGRNAVKWTDERYGISLKRKARKVDTKVQAFIDSLPDDVPDGAVIMSDATGDHLQLVMPDEVEKMFK